MKLDDVAPQPWQTTHAHPLVCDVISVQSQVVYGSVGNSIAVPALVDRGLNVVAVPTVLLSNTPHYPSCYGGELPSEWFRGYLKGLDERGVTATARSVLTGYLGSESKAADLAAWLATYRASHPEGLIVVDPVLGDSDTGYYVPEGLATLYREALAPLATGLVPNRFELECLCGKKLETMESIVAAARSLLTDVTQWVVVTSAAVDTAAGNISVCCVTKDSADIVRHTALPLAPKGTGDLFGAALTARLLAGIPLMEAVRLSCLRTEQAIIEMAASGGNELRINR